MFLVDRLILIAAVLLILAIASSKLSSRMGLPVLVLFLVVGMLAGEDGLGGITFDNYVLAHGVGTVALAMILFDGGLRTDLRQFRAVMAPALTLASVGVVLTATITTELLGGQVDFHDGTVALCTAVALAGGTASCTVDDFTVGTHAITARYSGDGDTGAAVSFALAQQVLALPTTTSVSSDCSRTFSASQPFTLQATIAASSLGGVPGGSVDFLSDSGVMLCQAVALNAATAVPTFPIP